MSAHFEHGHAMFACDLTFTDNEQQWLHHHGVRPIPATCFVKWLRQFNKTPNITFSIWVKPINELYADPADVFAELILAAGYQVLGAE